METRPSGDITFEAGAFHPGLENGRASGRIRISHSGVQFESARGELHFPLEGLKVALGGANDRLLFFTHPSQPDAAIHTADHSVLKHPVIASRPEMTVQVGRVQTKKRIAAIVMLAVIAMIVGGIAGVVLAKDRIVALAARAIPIEWEVKLGDKIFSEMVSAEELIDDPVLKEQLAMITDPLVNAIDDNRYPLKFHIVEDADVNAYAIPGGNVVLHSALLLSADTPEEVAGTLAHEIAHVTHRHSFRSIISSMGLYAILQTLIGDVSGLVAVLANNSAFLLDQKFSRDFEREADNKGWEYLLKANIDPRGEIEFFRKMKEQEEKMTEEGSLDSADGVLSIISTHPASGERMASLQEKWDKLDRKTGFRKFELNYAEFKDRLRTRLHSAPNSERN